ncbi:trace amine-associated receptor 8b-like [Stylophora pistillata]|uniref:5-hydroxytryptamine receptor 4 n=1 Tax=Stylophora pistillata TaxID=50429 RepID=A0A2B4SAD4_STYPI|nr:trace amine-associated receptor 8b-like [Stylophora pistillata]PFX25538.1 5-hydroxytryptamine receptor 4 [Stylophora pistillata]
MAALNQNSSEPFTGGFKYNCETTQEAIFLVLYAVVGLVMFFGNSFVCVVFLASRKLRHSFMNIFLLSLSASDVLMAAFVIPFYTVHCFRDCPHSLTTYCWLLRKARDFVLAATTLNICAITYDRFLAILRPLQYGAKMTRLRVGVILTAVWLIPSVVAATRNAWNQRTDNDVQRHLKVKLYDIFVVIIPVLLFQIGIVTVNIQIIHKIHRHEQAAKMCAASHSPDQHKSDLREISRLKKGTTSCVIVVMTFVVCWLPKTVHNFSYIVDPPDPILSSPLFFRICFTFLFIQSSFNPFIYTVYKAQFRKAAGDIIAKFYPGPKQPKIHLYL